MVSLSEGRGDSREGDEVESSRSREGDTAGQAQGSRGSTEEHQGDQDLDGEGQDDVFRHSDGHQSDERQEPRFSTEPERYTNPVSLWTDERGYEEGETVWYEGTYWRCEADHPRDQSYGPPNEALHLWTPTHSTSPYNPAEGVPTDTAFSSCSDLPLAMPQPTKRLSKTRAMLEKDASPPRSGYTSGSVLGENESHEKDDSPDSAITVTPQNSRPTSIAPRDDGPSSRNDAAPQLPQQQHQSVGSQQQGTTAYLSAKADEGIRYLASRHEKHKAGMADELKAELRGHRIFRLGGLGMWAYSGDVNQDRAKEALWTTEGQELGREGWLESARRRTHYYKTSIALKPLIQWHLHTPSSGPLPRNALPIGYEGGDGAPLFAARAWHEGGLHIGKAGNHLYHGASISYGGAEITLDTFEVLCGPLPEEGGGSGLLKWMMFRHGEMCGVEGWQPVEGGREKSGEVLLIAKGEWERGQHPGKVRIGDDHAHVPWGGGEVWVRPFQVLAYAHSIRR